jgi:hypothetical protein
LTTLTMFGEENKSWSSSLRNIFCLLLLFCYFLLIKFFILFLQLYKFLTVMHQMRGQEAEL